MKKSLMDKASEYFAKTYNTPPVKEPETKAFLLRADYHSYWDGRPAQQVYVSETRLVYATSYPDARIKFSQDVKERHNTTGKSFWGIIFENLTIE